MTIRYSPLAIRHSPMSPCPNTKTCPIAPAPACACSTARASCSSAAAPTAPSTSTRPMSGRCRRAASTRARILIRRRCASSTRKPTSRSVEKLGEIADWLTYDIPRDIVGAGLEGQVSRPEAEVVRAALHRRRQRDRHRDPGRRTQAGIHRLALGADGKPSGPGGAVQARDLRAGGEGVLEVREVADAERRAKRKRGRIKAAFSMSSAATRSVHRGALQVLIERLEVIELGDRADRARSPAPSP